MAKLSTSLGGSRWILAAAVAVPDADQCNTETMALCAQIQVKKRFLDPPLVVTNEHVYVSMTYVCLTGVDTAGRGPERLGVLVGREHGRGVGGTVREPPGLALCGAAGRVLLRRDAERIVTIVLVVLS